MLRNDAVQGKMALTATDRVNWDYELVHMRHFLYFGQSDRYWSFWPNLFCILVSLMASKYNNLQNFETVTKVLNTTPPTPSLGLLAEWAITFCLKLSLFSKPFQKVQRSASLSRSHSGRSGPYPYSEYNLPRSTPVIFFPFLFKVLFQFLHARLVKPSVIDEGHSLYCSYTNNFICLVNIHFLSVWPAL